MRIAFGVQGEAGAAVKHFDFDSLRICHGQAPQWTGIPDDLTVSAGGSIEWKVSGVDPDGDALVLWLTSAPDFVLQSPGQYSPEENNWSTLLTITPKADEKTGEYPATVEVSDSCLRQQHKFIVTVK